MFVPKLSFFVVPLPTMYRPCLQAFFLHHPSYPLSHSRCNCWETYLALFIVTYLALFIVLDVVGTFLSMPKSEEHLWQVQINFSMTRDDACALIVQVAGCATAWILEDEEAEANALSRAGRIARPRQRHLVHAFGS